MGAVDPQLQHMRNICDPSQPVDVGLFDCVIAAMYDGSSGLQMQQAAAVTMAEFQQMEQSWTQVDRIVTNSRRVEAKFIALMTLESAISVRWNLLSAEQRLGIRNWVVNMCSTLSNTPEALQANRMLLERLNFTLVQVLKKEWPQNWPTFISDIVQSSVSNDSLMQNNLAILRQLSEEIFDFAKGRMTQVQIQERKDALNTDFGKVFDMMAFVLQNKNDERLVVECLRCIERYLGWIPLGYIFEQHQTFGGQRLVDVLSTRFLPHRSTRNAACRCMTEIGSLASSEHTKAYDDQFVTLFMNFMQQLHVVIPGGPQWATLIPQFAQRGDAEEEFVSNATQFLSGWFRQHLPKLEQQTLQTSNPQVKHMATQAVQQAHVFLIGVTGVEEKEVFKAVVEYWQWIAEDVHKSLAQVGAAAPVGQAGQSVLAFAPAFGTNPAWEHPRQQLYRMIFCEVRKALIKRMAKPEEVLVYEDENGEIVSEKLKDVDALALYDMMREALVFLCHLDAENTEHIMLDMLQAQVDMREWSPTALSVLCWAVGSISGAMGEDDERRFIVSVIKDLLGLCEAMRGKPNKATIASNIMYVVGQYPRFLRAHWKFLRTVILKLFEFMHESFEGVQDMACETFLKITHSCKEKFVEVHPGETQMFVQELLTSLTHHVQDLKQNQTLMFYEATGLMIGAAQPQLQETLVGQFLSLPNVAWQQVMAGAKSDMNVLSQVPTMYQVSNVLKQFVKATVSVGPGIRPQIFYIFEDMMKLYTLYAGLISSEVASKGEAVTRHAHVRGMRIVKKEILRLIEEYVKCTVELQLVVTTVLPPLLEHVLTDYNKSCTGARDAQVLSLVTVLVQRLEDGLASHVPQILDATMAVTLEMIKTNQTDNPEHRVHFFRMLKALNHHCFAAFLQACTTNPGIVESIVWALKHTEQNVQDTGLETLHEFLEKVKGSQMAFQFFEYYLLRFVIDIFGVLTDTMHKTGFDLHCQILQLLLGAAVVCGQSGKPLLEQPQGMLADQFVKERCATNLAAGFSNLSQPGIVRFVDGMFAQLPDANAFREHIRDFLCELKEFAGQDNAALFDKSREAEAQRKAAEAQRAALVPGLAKPATAQQLAHAPGTADIGMQD